jgi:transcription elongation factor GreA
MTDRHPMTRRGYKSLQNQLHQLKTVERRRVSEAIKVAREHGDLSENAEYDAAKNEQGLMEARIRDIELKLSTAQVVDISELKGEKVVFGATVCAEDIDSGEVKTFTIVGADEVDVSNGLISYESPLARAFIGKREGDTARVVLPAGEKEYEIQEIKFVDL